MNKWLFILLVAVTSPLWLPALVIGLVIASIEEAAACFHHD